MRIVVFTSFLLMVSTVFAVEISSGIDKDAQLPFWEIKGKGMSLRLVQRLPMQTRGFFLARGFNHEQVERVAQSCAFQTVFRNTSDANSREGTLSYKLTDWRVLYRGESRSVKTREAWLKEWQAEGIKKQVQLAFEWAIYPTQQQYKPGDYNWGLSTFNLLPGSKFDLQVVWYQFGRMHKATIKNMECAADINPQPDGSM